MLHVLDIGLNRHGAEELADRGVTATGPIENLDLGVWPEVDCFAVAGELDRAGLEGPNDARVGDDSAARQADPGRIGIDEDIPTQLDGLPLVSKRGGRKHE